MTTPFVEKPILFGPDRGLFGIACHPRQLNGARAPLVIMPNSGLIHRAGANRVHVLLSRALAREGISSFRFDLSGVGDSRPRDDITSLSEIVRLDLGDALDVMAQPAAGQGFVIAGLCSGAYDGLASARHDDRVLGVVAIDLFASYHTKRFVATHYARRLLRPASWKHSVAGPRAAVGALIDRTIDARRASEPASGVRPIMAREEVGNVLTSLGSRGAKALFIFTGGLQEHYNYHRQFADCFPEHTRAGTVTHEYYPAADHTFVSPVQREGLIRRITRWVSETTFPTVAEQPTP